MRTDGAIFGLLIATLAATVNGQSLPTGSPESVGMSSERLGRIESTIRREIEQDRMPGAVVAIARQGHILGERFIFNAITDTCCWRWH